MRLDRIPEKTGAEDEAELWLTRFETRIRRTVQKRRVSFGFRLRRFRRRKSGASTISRIVLPVMLMSSSKAPSELSSEIPLHPSMTFPEIVMLRNPPLDSVPHLIRP